MMDSVVNDSEMESMVERAILKLIRTLPTTWVDIFESLSQIEQRALSERMVQCGLAECRFDIKLIGKTSGRTDHLLYIASGRNWAVQTRASACEDTNRFIDGKLIEETDALSFMDVRDFRLSARGELARSYDLDGDTAKAVAMSRSGSQQPFKVLRIDYEAHMRHVASKAAVRGPGLAVVDDRGQKADSVPEQLLKKQPNSHSDDYASAWWNGEHYVFTTNQAACVKVLWIAHDSGTPVVSGAAILDEAGISNDRLNQVFRSKVSGVVQQHPSWGVMIVSPQRGRYRLAEPTAE